MLIQMFQLQFVISTRTTDGHIYVEHVVKIEHVTAVNPSTTVRMQQISSNKKLSSTTIPTARPFDEFSVDSTTLNNPGDGQSNSSIPKSD